MSKITHIHVQCMTNQMIVTCRKFISVPTNTHDTLTTNKISNLFQLEGNSLISFWKTGITTDRFIGNILTYLTYNVIYPFIFFWHKGLSM